MKEHKISNELKDRILIGYIRGGVFDDHFSISIENFNYELINEMDTWYLNYYTNYVKLDKAKVMVSARVNGFKSNAYGFKILRSWKDWFIQNES